MINITEMWLTTENPKRKHSKFIPDEVHVYPCAHILNNTAVSFVHSHLALTHIDMNGLDYADPFLRPLCHQPLLWAPLPLNPELLTVKMHLRSTPHPKEYMCMKASRGWVQLYHSFILHSVAVIDGAIAAQGKQTGRHYSAHGLGS